MSDLTNIQEQVFSILNLSFKNRTPKGWLMGASCPRCGKNDKFGVKLNLNRDGEYKNHVTINCFHGSCEFSGNENTLFREIGRDDLIQEYEYREELSIAPKIKEKTKYELLVEPLKKRYPPLGYKRVYSNEYLEERGFVEEDFQDYHIGITNLESKLKDYVLFLIQEEGNSVGWVARITWSKEKLREENQKRKEENKKPMPKYRNEGGVEFSETFFGIDEITDRTKTVILVEGILDKTSVTRKLNLTKSEDIKCLCTFGKKISPIQIAKLKLKGQNIENIILMYDPDAVTSIKEYSYNLVFEFKNILIANLTGDKDPGDMNSQEILQVLQNTETFLSYRLNTLNRRKL